MLQVIKEKAAIFFTTLFLLYGIALFLCQLSLCLFSIDIIPFPFSYIFLGFVVLTWLLRLNAINMLLIYVGVYLAIVYKFDFPWYVGFLAICPWINYIAIPIIVLVILI